MASSPASPSCYIKCRNTRAPYVWSFSARSPTATPSIVEIRDFLLAHDSVRLAGLEHLDWRYVRAVGYSRPKRGRQADRNGLAGGRVSDDEAAVEAAAEHICELARARDGEGFIAISPEARKTFWLDRSRTAAIAKHTNAFKINEDVVIPLERLGEYSDGIERINIELSIQTNSNSVLPWSNICPANSPSTKWEQTCQPPNCWANAANTP